MYQLVIKTHCENCGGDAYRHGISNKPEIIMEFLEDEPFACESCGTKTFISFDKRLEN